MSQLQDSIATGVPFQHIRAALDAVARGMAGYNEAMALGEHIAELEHALAIAEKQIAEMAADYREALG